VQSRQRSSVAPAVVFVAIGLLLSAALWWSQREGDTLVVSGFVEADHIRLGSRVGGRVRVVHVEEGDHVAPGATLVELEPFDLNEERAGAAAALASARAGLARFEAGLRDEERAQAHARRDRLAAQLERLISGPRAEELATGRTLVTLAEAELALATIEESRASQLHTRGVETAEQLDRAVTAKQVAQASLAVRRDALTLLEKGTRREELDAMRAEVAEAEAALALAEQGYREEEIEQARASFSAAESTLARVDRHLEELAIRTPTRGIVEAITLRPGDLLAANAPALSLLDPSRLWVRAYVPEGRLVLTLGQEVSLHVDPFPDQTFHGRVSYIASEAEFTPGNVQTPEERSKQVFRIKITLIDGLDRLRPGMSADVVLDAGAEDSR
jgi:HlyD family secretion protein